MASPWLTVSTVWALASAVGVAVIGLGVLRHHQVRPRGRLAFGAFTLVGGIQIGTINLASMVDGRSAATYLHSSRSPARSRSRTSCSRSPPRTRRAGEAPSRGGSCGGPPSG